MNIGYLVKQNTASWCYEDHCWEFRLERPEAVEDYKVIAWEYLEEKESFDD